MNVVLRWWRFIHYGWAVPTSFLFNTVPGHLVHTVAYLLIWLSYRAVCVCVCVIFHFSSWSGVKSVVQFLKHKLIYRFSWWSVNMVGPVKLIEHVIVLVIRDIIIQTVEVIYLTKFSASKTLAVVTQSRSLQ